ncbi:MAG: hypothetical protein J7J61_09105 [Candidatus Hydrothermae bacterium]|nr:hypothetical protein [Candidatus Hydrothermae bacterium]
MLTAEITLEKYDKNGQLLQSIKHKSRSFLKQFIQFIEAMTRQANTTGTDITGTARTIYGSSGYSPARNLFCTPGAAHGYADSQRVRGRGDEVGIVVGSGTTAVAPDDYKLETQIAHGTGTGQLIYLGCGLKPVVVSAPDAYMDLVRFFENQSGGDVTINEVGIYAVDGYDYYQFCICRDVLATSVTVANGELLKVRYRIKVSVS